MLEDFIEIPQEHWVHVIELSVPDVNVFEFFDPDTVNFVRIRDITVLGSKLFDN